MNDCTQRKDLPLLPENKLNEEGTTVPIALRYPPPDHFRLEGRESYLIRVSIVKERHPPSNASETSHAGVLGNPYVFHAPDVSIIAS